jgi:hypothetical protein
MLNLIGWKCNKLTVVEFVGRNKKRVSLWRCLCECGCYRIATSSDLRSLRAKSCGCLFKNNGGINKHGNAAKKTIEYSSWAHMKSRCLNKNHKQYNDYGGRGIKVCESWINSFENFLSDMGKAPSLSHTIERIDVNGDYELNNCKWATRKEQSNNRRSSVLITINGITKNLKHWCEYYGVSISTVCYRRKRGYPMEKLFK